jgi:hypothetical protein
MLDRNCISKEEFRTHEITDLQDLAFIFFSLEIKDNFQKHLKNLITDFSHVHNIYTLYYIKILKQSTMSENMKYLLGLMSRDNITRLALTTG